jgi:hypothetical protein
MSESIYLVWNPLSEFPIKIRHEDAQSARDEARRLADKFPGTEFFVLRAVESIKRNDDPYTRKSYCRS